MSKSFYADYVRHALRFYSRTVNGGTEFKTDIDKQNWMSCKKALEKYNEGDLKILLSVYSGYDTLPDEVYNTSQKYKVKQNYIWDMMKDLEHHVARYRGLI